MDNFLNIAKKEIKKGNREFISYRFIKSNGKTVTTKQALLDIGIINSKEIWKYILELKPDECFKISKDYDNKRDFNSEMFEFIKLINKKQVYIKLTINDVNLVCLSFHIANKEVFMKKIYCYNCNTYVEAKQKKEKNVYEFRGKSFEVEETIVYCPNCDLELLPDEVLDNEMNKIYNAYLNLFDLSFKKIKEIRNRLNISQETMAKILGWSKKSIVRYETGESIPQGEYLETYISLQKDPFLIIKLLEKKKKDFKEQEYYNILKKLPFYEEYKAINAVLYILENNPIYETALMKNMFAVDFNHAKKFKIPITDLKYVHMDFGPVIHNRNDFYNLMLKNSYIELEIDEDKTKFRSVYKSDKNLFSKTELSTLKETKNILEGHTAKELSDWSHKFKGWEATKTGEFISYEYAKFLDFNKL